MTIYAVIFFFNTGPAIANAVGMAVGLIVSFALNRVWTFSSNRSFAHVLPKYLLTAATSYLLNLGAVLAAVSYYSTNPYLTQLLGVAIYSVCMFFGCRRFYFALAPFQRTVPG